MSMHVYAPMSVPLRVSVSQCASVCACVTCISLMRNKTPGV